MTARETALAILIACRRSGAWADAALQSRLKDGALSPSDAALCSRLVYGVTQNKLLLDFYLAPLCHQRLERLEPPLLEILRLGAYQILFLDRVPPSAAVDTAVELTRACRRERAAGLVNAVLRRLSRSRGALPPIPQEDWADYLSVRWSHPRWLTQRLLALLGRQEAEALLRLHNAVAPVTVQVNPLKTDAQGLASALTDEGLCPRPHPWAPECLEWTGAGDVAALASFQAGLFTVQDAAARLVSLAAGIAPGQRVLDLCAAPGGKTFSAAFAMEDRGEIVACDVHENKLQRIRSGARRLGLGCIRTAAADGRRPPAQWHEGFDTVLVDAPCSGLGVIRKKPDIRYKDPADFSRLPALQGQLLEAGAACVRPGGTLVYSTCTLLPEENEAVTQAFLSRRRDFVPSPFALPGPVGHTEGAVTLWPQRHGTDGFYICRMERRCTNG